MELPAVSVTPPQGFSDVVLCGRGATSRVYRAQETATGHPVALKRLHRHLVRSQDALGRLRRELDALTALRHPGIVAVKDVLKWEGDPTLVMEFVDGEDLKERIVRVGRLPHEETLRVARAFLDILATTHAAGIVHRDLKPQNIRIARDDSLHLLDFGSARLDAASQLTTTGTTVGTPEYMAPELFAGSVYDPRVDLYGVGATLFECVTGRAPQSADSLAELAWQRTSVDVPPVRSVVADVPQALAQVIDRCLARQPEDRFPSAQAAVWALDNPLAEQQFLARRSSHPPCVQCGHPIAPDSSICAHCQRTRPFAFNPGRSHVQIYGVENPARFLEWLATLLPERTAPGQLLQFSEQLATLSFAELRLVSFVHHDDAEMLVAQLKPLGVRAGVVHEDGISAAGKLAVAVTVGAGLYASSIGVAAAVGAAAVVVDRLLALEQAQQGMLAVRTWRFKHAWGALQQNLVRVATTTGLLAAAGWSATWDGWTFKRATLVALGALGAGLLATARSRLHLSRSNAMQTPEPTLAEKAGMAVRITPHPLKRPEPTGRMNPVVGAFAIMVGLALVPVELMVLGNIGDRLGTAVGSTPPGPVDAPVVAIPSDGKPRAPTVITRIKPAQVLAGALGLTPLALVAAALLMMRRRTGKLREDARVLYSELDLMLMQRLSKRRRPVHRHGLGTGDPISRIAALKPADAFVAEAVARAAEIAPLLTREHVLKLGSTLEQLARQTPQHTPEAERSLLSRCILETDPGQRTRFEFLALEGQLYTAAATAWSQRLKERGK